VRVSTSEEGLCSVELTIFGIYLENEKKDNENFQLLWPVYSSIQDIRDIKGEWYHS
jgi:hypothetical protein